MSRLILASNRLPVRLGEDNQPERTTGGLASALHGAGLTSNTLWVGWPGIPSEDISDPEALQRSMREIGAKPVLLNREEIDGFYEGFSNSTLWPLLHYMIERSRFHSAWRDAYERANRRFAEVILEEANAGDVIWVHDYHLFLLPSMLRESGLDVSVGFFLHTPFPSSEIFRALPGRNEVLQGLLGADLIGFHTYDYLRHFRSSLLRMLGVESEVDTVWHGGRSPKLGVYPIGHNREGFEAAMATETYRTALGKYNDQLGDKIVILSVERLDYTKGVPQKLEAIRIFLEKHPEMRSNVLFLLIAVPSRQGVEEYDELTDNVKREVGSINGDYGDVVHAPVHFLHRGFPPEELAALYARAEVCLVTPLVDGMNLVAKEYIACKIESLGARPGALVLSEFAGAAQEMSHALLVNPYDEDGVAKTLSDAIAMSDDEKRHRTFAMQTRLSRRDASAWARLFLDDLKDASTSDPHPRVLDTIEHLPETLAEEVQKGKRLALFLDYDGTLRGFVNKPEDAVPDPDLCPLLARLAKVPGVLVTVVSGRPHSFLQEHFADLGVALVAEHGFRWSLPDRNEWEMVNPRVDTSWKELILPHLQQASDLTPGTWIEQKQSSIVWHYRRAEPEFGLWRAHGLLSELTDITANLPVSVHHGKKIVEVASQMVNKGIAVDQLIREWKPDYALVVGDDQTDETMFALEPKNISFHTIHVGTGSTRAERQTTIKGLRQFLETLDQKLNG